MPPTEPLSAQRARIARNAHYRGEDHPDTIAARRDYAASSIADYVTRIVDSAPELTEKQCEAIAALLRPASPSTSLTAVSA